MLYICLVAKDQTQQSHTHYKRKPSPWERVPALNPETQAEGGLDSGNCLVWPSAQSWASFQYIAQGFSK